VKPLRYLAPAGLLFLLGCSSQTSAWSQYYQILRQSWLNTTGKGTVNVEQAAAIPYASLAYRVNGGSEMLLVLATDTRGDQLWTAASRVVLLTHDGRILRSVGLPQDRAAMASQTRTPLPPPAQALQAPYSSSRIMDFPDVGLHGIMLNCVSTARGRQLVTIFSTAIATTRVDEVCQSRNPRWSFTDSYWVDSESGFVWQSLQHLHPSGTTVQVKILRPPD
jgi:hypothetical protein